MSTTAPKEIKGRRALCLDVKAGEAVILDEDAADALREIPIEKADWRWRALDAVLSGALVGVCCGIAFNVTMRRRDRTPRDVILTQPDGTQLLGRVAFA